MRAVRAQGKGCVLGEGGGWVGAAGRRGGRRGGGASRLLELLSVLARAARPVADLVDAGEEAALLLGRELQLLLESVGALVRPLHPLLVLLRHHLPLQLRHHRRDGRLLPRRPPLLGELGAARAGGATSEWALGGTGRRCDPARGGGGPAGRPHL